MAECEHTATIHRPGHHLHGRRVDVVSEQYDFVWRRRWLGEFVDVRAVDGQVYALPVEAVRISNSTEAA